MTTQTLCLLIFVLTLAGYALNRWPLALVSMTSFAAMLLTGCLKPEDALACFSNSSAIIMGSMFVVAGGLNRTRMIHRITSLVYRVSGGSFRVGLAGYCLVTLLIAQVMPSAILTFTICYPLVSDFCLKMEKSPSRGLFSIALVSIVSVTAFPIGSGATVYALNNELFAAYGIASRSGMFDAFLVRLPSILAAVLCAVFICPGLCPDTAAVLPKEKGTTPRVDQGPAPLDGVREFLGYGIFCAVVLGILFAARLQVELWTVTLTGAICVVLTGVLTEKEAVGSISLPPILLYIGSLGLGKSLASTGCGDLIAGLVSRIVGADPNPYLVYAVFWFTGLIFTQLMSNIALYQSLTPVLLLTCASLGWNPTGLINMLFTACFTSYLTPLSTVCIPYLMDVGGYRQRDLLRVGWVPALLISLVTIPWTVLLFPPR